MTKKSFLNLTVISFLLIIFAAVSINFNSQTYNFGNRGNIFLTNFTKNVNDITLISIESFGMLICGSNSCFLGPGTSSHGVPLTARITSAFHPS